MLPGSDIHRLQTRSDALRLGLDASRGWIGAGMHPFGCVYVLSYVRVFICMCVSMCESWFYKYKVLMMAVKQLKEGREDEHGA